MWDVFGGGENGEGGAYYLIALWRWRNSIDRTDRKLGSVLLDVVWERMMSVHLPQLCAFDSYN
jgi:hypothetical protein